MIPLEILRNFEKQIRKSWICPCVRICTKSHFCYFFSWAGMRASFVEICLVLSVWSCCRTDQQKDISDKNNLLGRDNKVIVIWHFFKTKFNAGLAMIERCLKENRWRCKWGEKRVTVSVSPTQVSWPHHCWSELEQINICVHCRVTWHRN